jgi:hypothetical protein
MKPFLAILAVALALPMSAFAAPADLRQAPGVTSGSLGVTNPQQDLRNPDQRVPVVHSAPAVHALGTDVAARDQQASEPPTGVRISVPRDDGFDWAAASIGAAGGIALLVAMLGTTVALRRRRRPSVAAF